MPCHQKSLMTQLVEVILAVLDQWISCGSYYSMSLQNVIKVPAQGLANQYLFPSN